MVGHSAGAFRTVAKSQTLIPCYQSQAQGAKLCSHAQEFCDARRTEGARVKKFQDHSLALVQDHSLAPSSPRNAAEPGWIVTIQFKVV